MSDKPIVNATEEETECLVTMFRSYQQLKELGWQDAMYCPRGAKDVLFIEAGSTGVHKGFRDKDGGFWVFDGETYPANPILWRRR